MSQNGRDIKRSDKKRVVTPARKSTPGAPRGSVEGREGRQMGRGARNEDLTHTCMDVSTHARMHVPTTHTKYHIHANTSTSVCV